jgi:ribonuclease P/MRP protein subunit POP5
MVRIKHRYILFEILYAPPHENAKPLSALLPSPDRLTTREIFTHICQTIEVNFGDYGAGVVISRLQGTFYVEYTTVLLSPSLISVIVKYFNPLTGLGIIRAPRDHFQIIWAALTLTQNIRKQPCAIRVLHIGGKLP